MVITLADVNTDEDIDEFMVFYQRNLPEFATVKSLLARPAATRLSIHVTADLRGVSLRRSGPH
jgi:hypothetical protein